jgi:hypothetical protein
MFIAMSYGREVAHMSNERLVIELLVQIQRKDSLETSPTLCVIEEELMERLINSIQIPENQSEMAMSWIEQMDCMVGNLFETLLAGSVDEATGYVNYILDILEKGGV